MSTLEDFNLSLHDDKQNEDDLKAERNRIKNRKKKQQKKEKKKKDAATSTSQTELNIDIDLSKLGRNTTVLSFFKHFNRVSTEASHQLVEVSINLCSLWYANLSSERGVYKGSHCERLFTQLLYRSSTSLVDLTLIFESQTARDYLNPPLRDLIKSIIGSVKTYTSLKKIHIEAPTAISFKMENDSNEKFFEVIDNTRHLTELTSANIISYRDIKSLIQVGNGFTEGELNLTEFIVGPDYLMSNKNITPLDVLSESKSTLKQLVIADNTRTHGKDLFDFVLQCRNLEELTIDAVIPHDSYPSPSSPDPITLIKVPEGLERDNSMKRLCLRASKHVIDWKGLIKWMGKGLESLYLEGFDQWSDKQDLYLLRDINDYISLLETYRGSLKSVEFHRLACQVNSISNPSNQLTSFPNLEYLSFYDVENSIYKPFISNISFPKLHALVFTTFKTNQESFNCLVSILKSCSTTLKALQYNHYRSKAPKLPLASEQEELLNFGLEFPELETISFGRTNEEVGRWFSGLSKGFPKLNELRSTDQLRRYFLVKSPELPQTQEHPPDWLEDGIDESEGHFVYAE